MTKLMNTEKKRNLHTVLHNPYLQIAVGIIVILTLILDDIFLSHHHGMFILSLWHILHGLPGGIDAIDKIWKYNRVRKKRRK